MMDGTRRFTVLLFCLAFVLSGALVAQQAPPGLIVKLTKAAGTLRGEGKSLKVHELALDEPITVTVNGKSITTKKAWRLTITGGPFAARATPPTIEIDGAAAGIALESPDQSELRLITFDPDALHQGAKVTIAYGDVRSQLTETLNLNR